MYILAKAKGYYIHIIYLKISFRVGPHSLKRRKPSEKSLIVLLARVIRNITPLTIHLIIAA